MLAHIPLALLLQGTGFLLVRRLGGSRRAGLWAGAFAAACACVMREVTQAEYRWIEDHGHRRAAMPDLQGTRFWEWNAHSIGETVVALAVVAGIAVVLGRKG